MIDALDRFERGDYFASARELSPEQWQYWASLAAIGRTSGTTDALVHANDPAARFHAGVAAWMEGDDSGAVTLLRKAPGAHAQRLARLILQQPLTVVSQLPWSRAGSWDLVNELRDPAFRLLNISFHPDDIRNHPYANIHDLVPRGLTPHFYLAEMLEWHLIPPNVRELGCAVIGHSSDYDIHIQAIASWLGIFDELLVLDSRQWEDISGLAPHAHVSVFPKVFGVPRRVPSFEHREREIDVFLSGTVVHPYHPDKDALVVQLLDMDGIELRMVNGFDAAADYYRNLATSKICVNYVRHPGALPTRGLEGLAMGCVVTLQEENVLHFFFDATSGVVPYGMRSGTLADAVRRILGDWESYARAASYGAARVREEFDLAKVASQYLRFATVVAARPRSDRVGPEPSSLVQKRAVVQKGWLPSYEFGGPLLNTWAMASMHRMERLRAADESARLLNDIAREKLLVAYHQPDVHAWLPEVVAPLDSAISKFPAALVPRLNLIRILLHFGDGPGVRRALRILDDTLAVSSSSWEVEPLDDVLPWDFCPSFFNYRRYFDTVTASIGQCADVRADLIAIILASLHYYRGHYAAQVAGRFDELECAARATTLDPTFAEYVLYYCRLLIDGGHDRDLRHAAELLHELAKRSARVLEIVDLGRRLPSELQGDWHRQLCAKATRFWRSTEMRENLPEPWLQPPFDESTLSAAFR